MDVVRKIGLNGNFNIGLFCYATDNYCLVGHDVLEKDISVLKETLKVPVHRISIAGTSLTGVFLAGNSSVLLVPEIIYPEEKAELDRLEINYVVIKTSNTALGNNILCNDNGAIVNPTFKDSEVEDISKALGVEVVKCSIEDLETVGALGVANNDGAIVSKSASGYEIDIIKNILKVSVSTGTVNLGSGYIHSGVIFNKNGLLVGLVSGGVEINDVSDALFPR